MVAYRVPRHTSESVTETAPAWQAHEGSLVGATIEARSEALCRLTATLILIGLMVAYAFGA